MTTEHPIPEVIDVMAEVAEYLTAHRSTNGWPSVIRSLSRFAGAAYEDDRNVAPVDEREAMMRLAAHAVARVAYIDRRGSQ